MFLHSFTPNPILFTLGPVTVHWYGVFLSVGALVGFIVFRRLGRRYGLSVGDLENTFFLTILAGIVGARLYHVLNEWSYYAAHPGDIAKIWNGGLAIHGAMIAGGIAIWLYGRRRSIGPALLFDLAAPALLFGQAIGRWGNYFNQELFGRPTNLPWGIPIDTLNRPIEYFDFPFFHPTFLYESLGAAAIGSLLLALHRVRLRRGPTGQQHALGSIALVAFLLEPLLRAATELLRVDRVPLIAGVRLPLLVSIIIALAAGVILILQLKRKSP